MVEPAPRMTLIGLINPPTSRYAAGWSHPDARNDWLGADFFVNTARTLERGHFDLMFLPDTLAVPEDGDGEVATTLRTGGKGAVQLDPMLTLAAVAAATQRLGLGATVSTGFLPPYQIARSLLTLDHLSGGRCAWNVVTSTADAEARNFGHSGIASKAQRYDRADEVVTEVLDLMTTWAPDALRLDATARVFADPDRVRRTTGRRGVAPGPMTLPASPQGHPVLMQAGASARGLEFAARWAELVFVAGDGPEQTGAVRNEIRERARRWGRDPDHVRICAAVQPVVGATGAEAERVLADLAAHVDEADALRSLARLLHARSETLDVDGPAVDLLARHRGATGSDGFEDMLASVCRREGLTVRGLAVRQSLSQLTPQPLGSGEEVADQLCAWQDAVPTDSSSLRPSTRHPWTPSSSTWSRAATPRAVADRRRGSGGPGAVDVARPTLARWLTASAPWCRDGCWVGACPLGRDLQSRVNPPSSPSTSRSAQLNTSATPAEANRSVGSTSTPL